ncbi:MAG: hypothetical protein ACR2N2_12190 [Acidimicrobiia bacterium]
MRPIRLIETERDDFEGSICEFWSGDLFIGMAYWDGESTILQIYPDSNGDVHDLDVRELQMLLDTAIRIVDPDAFDDEMDDLRAAAGEPQWSEGEHPATVALLGEFDEQAVHRTDDGEGFFPRSVASNFIAKCEELDLAVTEMDGFELVRGELAAMEELVLEVPEQPMMTWSQFRSFANAMVTDTLSNWPSRETLVVAFVLKQPDGEEIVA